MEQVRIEINLEVDSEWLSTVGIDLQNLSDPHGRGQELIALLELHSEEKLRSLKIHIGKKQQPPSQHFSPRVLV